MSDQYTEQDTERARRAERTSAGAETQQLGLPAGAGYAPAVAAHAAPDRQNVVGILLVGLGALWLLSRMAQGALEIEAGMVLLTIASVFYFFGFWRRIYGLVIPGSILAGLSVGVTFANLTNGVSVLWGLSLGFLAIYGIGAGMFRMRNAWPVIPAVILFAVGTIVAVSQLPGFLAGGMIWLPMLLIGAGIYLGWIRKA